MIDFRVCFRSRAANQRRRRGASDALNVVGVCLNRIGTLQPTFFRILNQPLVLYPLKILFEGSFKKIVD